jgi:hypothetical protein
MCGQQVFEMIKSDTDIYMSRVTTKPTYEFATSMDPDQPGIRAV